MLLWNHSWIQTERVPDTEWLYFSPMWWLQNEKWFLWFHGVLYYQNVVDKNEQIEKKTNFEKKM